ncbi:helix-turn-helix domain-containing protein [Streptomyces sp. NPDC059002]|uniref:helix-turn-helix domain-containing protein n=1 Tax=Streptomyces sp. NPDC059002 TaxID=3346690 RepID=UPI0036C3BB72
MLKTRRAQMDRDMVRRRHPEAGLEPRPSRRPGRPVQGLSQEDLDRLLYCARGDYGRFERGARTFRDEFLYAVGQILLLSEEEFTVMWAFARGGQPPHPLHPQIGLSNPEGWQRLLDGQREITYVTDFAWNVWMYNEPFQRMFQGGKAPKNTLEWMLLTDEARQTLIDWDKVWAPSVIAQMEGAVARHPEHATLSRIRRAVLADERTGPILRGLSQGALHPDGARRRLLHPEHGPGDVTMLAAMPYSTPQGRCITVIYDADEATGRTAN